MTTDPSGNAHTFTPLARYERLLDISRSLNSTLDLTTLLEQIVYAAAELSSTEASSILLLDQKTGVLVFEAAIDPEGVSLESIEVPLNGSIAGWVVTHGEPVLIEDVSTDPRFFKQVDEASAFRTRNLMAVPMRARGKIIGCLEALNKTDGTEFTEEDVTTLTILAVHAAVAIQNARLFQQSDMIADMVHELRSPLSAIKATTHILNRQNIGEDRRREMITLIAQEADRLNRLTTDFLDLARLESGRMRLLREAVDLVPLIQSALQTVTYQANERQINLHIEISPLHLPEIAGDGEKLRQVLLNLLTNAIKYNRDGGMVTVQAIQQDEHIFVSVEDTGLGISADNLPHMFEKFYRVADTEGYTTGTGLGLAIAQRIIEGHGGTITVNSEIGVGTTFTFNLPVLKT